MKNSNKTLSLSLMILFSISGNLVAGEPGMNEPENNSPSNNSQNITISAISSNAVFVSNKIKFKKVRNFAKDNPSAYNDLIASVRSGAANRNLSGTEADAYAKYVLGVNSKNLTKEAVIVKPETTLTDKLTALDKEIQILINKRNELQKGYNDGMSGSRLTKEQELAYLNEIAKLDEMIRDLKNEYNLLAGKEPIKEGEDPVKESEREPTAEEIAAMESLASDKLKEFNDAEALLLAMQAERNSLLAKESLSESESTRLSELQKDIPTQSTSRDSAKDDYVMYVEANNLQNNIK